MVTYGSRWHLLSTVLDELLEHDTRLTAIVVVDNGCGYDLTERLKDKRFAIVTCVPMTENTGSAGGFAQGISFAVHNTRPELIWLLDDDNKPNRGCLHRLLMLREVLGANRHDVLLALRKSRTEQVKVVQGIGQMRVRANSFLGFHLFELPGKLIRRAKAKGRKRKRNLADQPLISIEYAPYGGLLFDASWVAKIGVPDQKFYLYGDDHEYTGRMIDAGGRIFLTSCCEIEDLEVSWSVKTTAAPPLVSKSSAPSKVCYVVRNRVYWEWKRHVTCPTIYFLNSLAYLTLTSIRGLIAERSPLQLFRRYTLIFRAIRAGLAGKLGRAQC